MIDPAVRRSQRIVATIVLLLVGEAFAADLWLIRHGHPTISTWSRGCAGLAREVMYRRRVMGWGYVLLLFYLLAHLVMNLRWDPLSALGRLPVKGGSWESVTKLRRLTPDPLVANAVRSAYCSRN